VISGAAIRFVAGEEGQFLDRIEEYVNTHRSFELKAVISQLVPNLLGCAGHHELSVRVRTLAAIEALIREFPSAFESALTVTVDLFWGKPFLFELQAYFDPNAVLDVAVRKPPSVELLEFTASLCRRKSVVLTNPDICQFLVELVLRYADQDWLTRRVIHAIQKQDPMFLVDQGKHAIDLILAQKPENYPPFAADNPAGWCSELKAYIAAISVEEWEEERTSIFREVATAIAQDQTRNMLFGVIVDLLKMKGKPGWEIFFDTFVAHFRDKKTPNLQALWKYFVTNFDATELLARSIEILNSSNPELCRNAIDVIREIVLSIRGSDELRPSMGAVIQALSAHIGHELVDIRKSSIFCYAAIASVFGPEAKKYIDQLSWTQQRLVSFYLQK
jgi:hypothetical protein